MSEVKKLDGKIDIKHRKGGTVQITVRDVKSRVEFIEIEMSWEEFCRAVMTNLADRPCTFELVGVELVGKTKQSKIVSVVVENLPFSSDERIAIAKNVATPHEVDGWKADAGWVSRSRDGVSHNGDGTSTLNIPFYRWVD